MLDSPRLLPPDTCSWVLVPDAPAVARDPFPIYAQLREHAPLCRVQSHVRDMWAVSRYEDVRRVLHDHESFSSAINGDLSLPYMITQDPPEHTRLRQMVLRAFTPSVVREQAPAIEARATAQIDRMLERGSVEFIDDFANPLPAQVIASLLGLPLEDADDLRRWSDDALHVGLEAVDTRGLPPGAMELLRYLLQHIRNDDGTSHSGFFAELGSLGREGVLSERELLLFCTLLLVAGHSTTTHLLGNGAALLARRPELHERLAAEPERLDAFVEEVLRYESPLQIRVRRCTREVEIHGRRLAPGTLVMALIGAANRDPERFPDPDTFDLDRDTGGHLGFGNGIHGCLGAALARLEGRICFRLLVERVGRIEPHPTRRRRLLTEEIALAWRGYRALPLILEAR